MWVRSSYWTGKIIEGQETALKAFVREWLLPGLAELPGVVSAQAFWPERREDGAPDIVCQIVVTFDSREDIDAMMASPERNTFRDQTFPKLKTMFDGNTPHIDLEVLSG